MKGKDKEWRAEKIKFTIDSTFISDDVTLGCGLFELLGEWHHLRLSVDLLERVMKAVKAINFDGDGVIDFVWTPEHPCIIGKIDKSKKRVGGFAIAPRIENAE